MKNLNKIFATLLLFWVLLYAGIQYYRYDNLVEFYQNEGYSTEVSRLFAKTELWLWPETQEYWDYKND